MAKPDYATLLAQIAAESNTEIKQQLIAQCYVFEEPLTQDEIQLFEYMNFGYVEPNPGYDANTTYESYVGQYFSDSGETTQ